MKMYAALKDCYCCVSFDDDFDVVKEAAEKFANNVYDCEIRIYEVDGFVKFYNLWHHKSFGLEPPVHVAKPKRHMEIYRSDLERLFERYIQPNTGYDEPEKFYEWLDDMKLDNVFREVPDTDERR